MDSNSGATLLARISDNLRRIISTTKRRGKLEWPRALRIFDTAGIWRRLSHLIRSCISMGGDVVAVRFVQSTQRNVCRLFGEL